MGSEPTVSGATATIERILEGWPTRFEERDLADLSRLTAEQADDLSKKMMAVLPAGPLGASEAARLGRLLTVLSVLSITPDPASVVAMRERYERADRMPPTVMRKLDELERPIARRAEADRGECNRLLHPGRRWEGTSHLIFPSSKRWHTKQWRQTTERPRQLRLSLCDSSAPNSKTTTHRNR
jgi:hypothetical protein